MSVKLVLTLRTSSSPHLYLDQMKEMIKNDEYLLPAMRGYLNYMKKTKRTFIQLPLQSEVIIAYEFSCNLTRGLSPSLTEFNKIEWTESDLNRWKENSTRFVEDIKELYTKMGYEMTESTLDDKIVKGVIDSFEKKSEKFKQLQEKKK